jgi:hypothetical protein
LAVLTLIVSSYLIGCNSATFAPLRIRSTYDAAAGGARGMPTYRSARGRASASAPACPFTSSRGEVPFLSRTAHRCAVVPTAVRKVGYSSERLCAVDFGASCGSALAGVPASVLGELRLSKVLLRAGYCAAGCGGAFARRRSSTLLLPEQLASSAPKMDTTRMRIMTLSRGNRSITVREVNCDYIMWPSPQSWPRGTICGLGVLAPVAPRGFEIFFDPPGLWKASRLAALRGL